MILLSKSVWNDFFKLAYLLWFLWLSSSRKMKNEVRRFFLIWLSRYINLIYDLHHLVFIRGLFEIIIFWLQ
jgi:hypothetical protein